MAEDGATVWAIVEREQATTYPSASFDVDVAAYIDQRWQEHLTSTNLYINRHTLAVSMPTRGNAVTLGEAARASLDAGRSLPLALIDALKTKFKRGQELGFSNRADLELALRRFESTIVPAIDHALPDLGMRRLAGADLLGFLKASLSVNPRAPVAAHPDEYLDSQLSDSFIDNRFADYLVMDGVKRQYVGVFTLKTVPPANSMQVLNPLLALPMRLRIAAAWRSYSVAEAVSFLDSARTFDEMRAMELRKLVRMAAAPQDAIDGDDTPKTSIGAQAKALKDDAKRRVGRFGALAASIAVYADTPDELELRMDIVSRTLEASGIVFIREREGALAGLCVGVPGNVRDPVRWHFGEASNMTDVSPIISLFSGSQHHPSIDEDGQPTPPNATLRSRYATVQYFNYHVGQLGHTLLVGPSRNGKTMFQMFLEAQFLKYRNSRIFNIDKDLSCKPQTLLLDGVHIDLDPARGNGLRMNPVSMATTEHGRSWLVGWLDRLLGLRGDQLSTQDVNDLHSALERVGGVSGARLSTLMSQLPSHLRARLHPWVEGGAYGQYFDHAEDEFSISRITTTEVGSLLAAGLNDVVSAYSEYAFYRIERFLMDREEDELGPTMIYFEEAGFLLDDPRFAAKARDYLMTLAKKRAFLVMTAQSPETFLHQPQLAASIRDNVATIIFLPNRLAIRPELSSKYREAFGLNNTQIELIAGAAPRREYCVFQPQTGFFRVMQAQFPPEIVNCLRSDVQSQSVLERTYDPADPAWKERYLSALANT